MERWSQKGDDLHNIGPRQSFNVVIYCRNGTAFSLELSLGIDSQPGARDHRRFVKPESAGSAAEPSSRAGVGAPSPLAFKHDAGIGKPTSPKWAAYFSAPARHVICFASSRSCICSRT